MQTWNEKFAAQRAITLWDTGEPVHYDCTQEEFDAWVAAGQECALKNLVSTTIVDPIKHHGEIRIKCDGAGGFVGYREFSAEELRRIKDGTAKLI